MYVGQNSKFTFKITIRGDKQTPGVFEMHLFSINALKQIFAHMVHVCVCVCGNVVCVDRCDPKQKS